MPQGTLSIPAGNDSVFLAQDIARARLEKADSNILVTKLPSLLSCEGMQASNSTLKHHENDVKNHEKNVEKSPHAPLEVGKLSYSVTKEKDLVTNSGTIDEMFNVPLSFDALKLRDGPHPLVGELYHTGECYRCKQTTQIAWYYSNSRGEKRDLCNECGWAVSKELEERLGS